MNEKMIVSEDPEKQAEYESVQAEFTEVLDTHLDYQASREVTEAKRLRSREVMVPFILAHPGLIVVLARLTDVNPQTYHNLRANVLRAEANGAAS